MPSTKDELVDQPVGGLDPGRRQQLGDEVPPRREVMERRLLWLGLCQSGHLDPSVVLTETLPMDDADTALREPSMKPLFVRPLLTET